MIRKTFPVVERIYGQLVFFWDAICVITFFVWLYGLVTFHMALVFVAGAIFTPFAVWGVVNETTHPISDEVLRIVITIVASITLLTLAMLVFF